MGLWRHVTKVAVRSYLKKDSADWDHREFIKWYLSHPEKRCEVCGILDKDIPDMSTISNHKALRSKYMSVDHIVSCSHGGTDDMSNLRLACVLCNLSKMDFIPDDIVRDMSREIYKRFFNIQLKEKYEVSSI